MCLRELWVCGTPLLPLLLSCVCACAQAPLLIDEAMIASMKQGSVTVDLAAESGGNIATTRPGEKYVYGDKVTCIGYTDMPSRLPTQASNLYGNNVTKLLLSMGDGKTTYKIDLADEVVRGCMVLKDGELMWPPPKPAAPPAAAKPAAKPAKVCVCVCVCCLGCLGCLCVSRVVYTRVCERVCAALPPLTLCPSRVTGGHPARGVGKAGGHPDLLDSGRCVGHDAWPWPGVP